MNWEDQQRCTQVASLLAVEGTGLDELMWSIDTGFGHIIAGAREHFAASFGH